MPNELRQWRRPRRRGVSSVGNGNGDIPETLGLSLLDDLWGFITMWEQYVYLAHFPTIHLKMIGWTADFFGGSRTNDIVQHGFGKGFCTHIVPLVYTYINSIVL